MTGRRFPALVLLPTLVVVLSSTGCRSGPQPILYPNDHRGEVGEERTQQDVEECRQLADAAGANRDPAKVTAAAKSGATGAVLGAAGGAVGGAISGGVGIGAAIGAATGATVGILRALLRKPPVSQTHRNWVDRCLAERGYDPMGWE